MAQKPANQNLSEAIPNVFNTAGLESTYEAYMDAMLLNLGRDITIYLPPAVSQSTANPEQLNPWMLSQDPRTANASDGTDGLVVEPIYVVYKAHIVHGPREPLPDMPFRLDKGDVQLTTVFGSMEDMNRAIEIEVDGMKFDMRKQTVRPIGLSTPKYLISVWTRKSGSNG